MNYNPNKPMKKGILIVSEKHERITIRRKRQRQQTIAVCPHCGKEVEWYSIEETSALVGKNLFEIEQSINDGKLETIQTNRGKLFVCSESVLKKFI